MTAREAERLAKVEQKTDDLKEKVEEIGQKLDDVIETLNQLTGGKKALMWVVGISTASLTAISTWLGVHRR